MQKLGNLYNKIKQFKTPVFTKDGVTGIKFIVPFPTLHTYTHTLKKKTRQVIQNNEFQDARHETTIAERWKNPGEPYNCSLFAALREFSKDDVGEGNAGRVHPSTRVEKDRAEM